jgi:hypothetical protein
MFNETCDIYLFEKWLRYYIFYNDLLTNYVEVYLSALGEKIK